tara:strand:- start:228 stop:554 length:327 start_codon:yes stop_codon:yes gene_type:complete
MLLSQNLKLTIAPSYVNGGKRILWGPPVMARALVLRLIKVYKVTLSQLFTGACRFYPSCADYMSEAVSLHGAKRGVFLGIRRLLRCHPFGGSGYDPVQAVTRTTRKSD